MIPQNNLKERGSPSTQNENRAQLSARRDRPSAPSQSRARQAPQGAGSGILQPREGAQRRRNGANPNISSEKVHSSVWLQQVELEGSSLRAYRHRPPARAGTRAPARRTETRGARRLRRRCHCVPAQLCSSPRSSRTWCRPSTARLAWGRPGSGFSSGRDWKPPLWEAQHPPGRLTGNCVGGRAAGPARCSLVSLTDGALLRASHFSPPSPVPPTAASSL